MKLNLNQNLTINGVNNLKDSIVEVEEKDAKSILTREWAVEVKDSTKSTTQPAEEPNTEEKKAETKQPAKAVVKKVAATKSTTKKAN